jgi:hypothetical protein
MAGVGDVPLHDQRGAPFTRVYDGDGGGARIDIGAFELQPLPPAFFGDYNQNGVVDAADYVVWRKTLGSMVPNFSGADGSGNGEVGPDDYGVWTAHFGETLGAGSGEQGAGSEETAVETFRIADSGLRIGESRGSSVKGRERDGWQVATDGSARRGDALLAWLASRDDQRDRIAESTTVGRSRLETTTDEFEPLDRVFVALGE